MYLSVCCYADPLLLAIADRLDCLELLLDDFPLDTKQKVYIFIAALTQIASVKIAG